MEIARKISVGGINGIKRGFKGIEVLTFVARIIGIARSAKVEEGDNGAYVKFGGDFQATNMDGEVITAPVMFLPEPASSLLENAVKSAEGGDVRFGFDIFVEPNESVAIGYNYKVKPLLEVKPSDPMADLMKSIEAPVPLKLEAPKTEGEKAPETPAADAKAPAKKK